MPNQSMRIARSCTVCGAPFEVKPSKLATGRGLYCSQSCKAAKMRTITKRPCEVCGTSFRPTSNQGTPRFCSRACYRAKPINGADSFWARLDKTGDCLEWTGYRDPEGYGQVWFEGGHEDTHRLAWRLANGPIPEGMVIRHFVCDNPPCCNPEHLRIGTLLDNIADMIGKRRQSQGASHGSRTHPDAVPRGERHHAAKLTVEIVRRIRELHAGGATHGAIAPMFGVSTGTVSKIVLRQRWAHVV